MEKSYINRITLSQYLLYRMIPLMIFLSPLINITSQSNKIDSLKSALSKNRHRDTTRVNLLNDIAELYSGVDSASSVRYALMAESLADSIGFKKGKALSYLARGNNASKSRFDTVAVYNYSRAADIAIECSEWQIAAESLGNMGKVYMINGRLKEGKECLERNIKLCTEHNCKSQLSQSLNAIGVLHNWSGEFVKALDYFNQGIIIAREARDKKALCSITNNTGSAYYNKGDYTRAQKYFLESVKLKEELGDRKGLINGYLNIGHIYAHQKKEAEAEKYYNQSLNLAEELNEPRSATQIYEALGALYQNTNTEKSLHNYTKSLEVARRISFTNGIIAGLQSIAGIHIINNHYDKALVYLNEALQLSKKSGSRQHSVIVGIKLGNAFYKMGNYPAALEYSLKYKNEAEEMKLTVEQQNVYKNLAGIYEEMGNNKKSLDYLMLYKQYSDSIMNESTIRKQAEQEYNYKFEIEKNNIENEIQQNITIANVQNRLQKTVIILLISGLILITLFAVFIYRQFVFKRSTNRIMVAQKEEITKKNLLLQQQSQAKDKLFSILAHDLNGSFTKILSLSDILTANTKDNDVVAMADTIHKSANNTYNLLENLLTWSQSRVGMIRYNTEQINLTSMIQQCISELDEIMSVKNVNIRITNHNEVYAECDKDMIRIIIRNLVVNAIKYSHKDGDIIIESKESVEGVTISVIDHGVGMTRETLNRILLHERVQSIHGTMNEDGTGLGLLICKEFVSKHNGTIWAESEYGKGSKVSIQIPHKSYHKVA